MTQVDLPLTVPVREIVMDALRELQETSGLDRDEAYLLARLERGEDLALTESPGTGHSRSE